jgi:hypothetical protein
MWMAPLTHLNIPCLSRKQIPVLLPTNAAEAEDGAFEEAGFVGSVSVRQFDKNQEVSVIQVKNIIMDDAIPVDTEVSEDSPVAEKSVYSV